jgi:hypothetical protein
MAIVDLIAVAMLALIAFLVIQNRRQTPPDDTAAPVDYEALRLAEEVKELRARIQVLERVITDNHGSSDLLQEIDRLRDR